MKCSTSWEHRFFLLKSLLKIEISKFAIWINMIKGQEVKASTNTGEEQENTSWQIETGWKLSLYFFWRAINCPQVHPDLLIFWQRSIHICRIQSYSPWFIFLTKKHPTVLICVKPICSFIGLNFIQLTKKSQQTTYQLHKFMYSLFCSFFCNYWILDYLMLS